MSTKTNILSLLENNRGQSISGESIATQLGVSRNAVWKAVNELKKDGYQIKAVTNKGYCLLSDNDILSAEGILPFLSHKELANQIFLYDTLESTNKTGKEMAIERAEHGTVILTDSQTAGRGRYNRAFHSPAEHGIYMSLILRPAQLGFSTPTLVTSFAAVCVCEAIEAITDSKPKIKWVNDVFINEKKICGILTEAVTDFESGSIEWVVVGIGINFSTRSSDFPKELQPIVGSIFPSGNATTTRNHLIAEIINRMVLPNRKMDEKEMMKKYRQRLWMLGKEVMVYQVNESYKATAIDVDDIGQLIIRNESGKVLSLSSGEISVKPIFE